MLRFFSWLILVWNLVILIFNQIPQDKITDMYKFERSYNTLAYLLIVLTILFATTELVNMILDVALKILNIIRNLKNKADIEAPALICAMTWIIGFLLSNFIMNTQGMQILLQYLKH